MNNRRLIEDSLPLAEISEESAREKTLRVGNPSVLHPWWARRPLAACRAAAYAALRPAPSDEAARNSELKQTAAVAQFDGSGVDEAASKLGDNLFRVLDPFSGGGTFPLAAQQLGCEVYSTDLNPVASLVQTATLVLNQEWGGLESTTKAPNDTLLADAQHQKSLLLRSVEDWTYRIEQRAREALESLYPTAIAGERITAYLWAHTISCQNPACRVTIPLIRQTWLSQKKKGPSTALKLISDRTSGTIRFEVVTGQAFDFDPSVGTIVRGNVRCPLCEEVTPVKDIRRLGQEKKFGERLLCVVTDRAGETGKTFRLPMPSDLEAVDEARRRRQVLDTKELAPGLRALPNEALPPHGTLGFRIQNYGYRTWSDLFTDRQLVALSTLAQLVHDSHGEREREFGHMGEADAVRFAAAVTTYLALMVSRLTNYCSRQCWWLSIDGERIANTFGRQALSMTWDFAETFPLNPISANWDNSRSAVLSVLEFLPRSNPAVVQRASADRLPFPDGMFDAILTDPPYYDAVPYSDLSDFFYVWLRRILYDVHPSLFEADLTPKRAEIVQNPVREKDAESFEHGMRDAFSEMRRVLKDDGIVVVVFAHKSTHAWETMLTGLLQAGLVVTASWPIETESRGRLRAKASASLASSVFIVCRKRSAHDDGFLDDVEPDLKSRLHERLDYFWSQGIRGADFFMSAIGPAVEVFGRHKRVLKLSGEEVTVAELLDKVRGIVADYALQRIVHGVAAGDVDEASRFYVIWRWAYGTSEVESGEAIHMAQSMGCEFSELVADSGVLTKSGDKVTLKGSVDRKKTNGLGEPRATGVLAPLIDVLHRAANLWAAGERQDLADFLATALPPGGVDRMQRLAQSIGDVLPPGDKERALYENFLVGARSLPAPTKKNEAAERQRNLF